MPEKFSYIPSMICTPFGSDDVEKLLWGGGSHFSRTIPFTMIRLGLYFGISQTLRFALRPLKQYDYICNLMAGIALGSSGLGLNETYAKMKNNPAQLQFVYLASFCGLLYHIFLISVKVDFHRMIKISKKVRVIAVTTYVAPVAVMFILESIFHPLTFKVHNDRFRVLYMASSNSILNIAPFLEDLHLFTTEVGQLSLSTAIIFDIFNIGFWTTSVIFSAISTRFLSAIVFLGAVISFVVFVLRPAFQWIIRRTPSGQPVKEVYVLGIFLLAGVTAALCDVIAGLPIIGMLIFGLSVPPGPPLGSAIIEMGEMFVKTCLLPFFYLSVGDMITIHGVMALKNHIVFELILIAGVLTKILAATLSAMIHNMSHQKGITLAFILNISGVVEPSYALVIWWRQRIDLSIATQIVVSNLIRGALMAPLALLCHMYMSKTNDSIQCFELSIQATSQNSKMRVLVCVDKEDEVPGIITLLEASNPTASNPIFVYVIHYIELVGYSLPVLSYHKKHSKMCKHNGCVHIKSAFKGYSDSSNGRVAFQLLSLVAPFKSMYEGLCRLSQDKLIPLIIVPFDYKSPTSNKLRSKASELNRKIQETAPCTVGIFLDKGTSNKVRSHQQFSYRILVIFFGGEDDREVLAYATRMSAHSGVSLTLLQIVLLDYPYASKEDKKIDHELVEEFRNTISDNACAVYREIQVDEWLQVSQIIYSLDNEYDLVILGRNHGESTTLDDDQLSPLSENPELGYVGEIFSSIETFETVSMLVLQHCAGVDRDALDNLMVIEDDI